MEVKRFDSSDKNVWKYVFDFGDAIAEAVLYKYGSFKERTVLCISVQSGCPVGCAFCGTGKQFIRNLTESEIVEQVIYCMKDMVINELDCNMENIEKFQIMFMSMGEPMLNSCNMLDAIERLSFVFPNAQMLVSTVAPKNKAAFKRFLKASIDNEKIGLQFSIHESNELKRNQLIPYKNKLTLNEIRDYGIEWSMRTKRPVYINYCVTENNHSQGELDRLKDLFPAHFFYFTFSVVCSADETMKDAGFRELDTIQSVSNYFLKDGYNVRVFNPAGQDDIGGGCGQLWYVQEWMKNKK